jgi:hypothetical protein
MNISQISHKTNAVKSNSHYIYLTMADPRAIRHCHINFVEYMWDVCEEDSIQILKFYKK